MTFRRSLHLSIAACVLVAMSLAAPASARPPLDLAGDYRIVGGTERVDRTTGKVIHTEFTLFSMLSGGFESAEDTPVATSYECVEMVGRFISCRAEETFTGSIAGIGTGTTEARVSVRCDLTTRMCAGSSRVRGVSGQLADVRGTVRFEGPVLAPGTYTARLNQY